MVQLAVSGIFLYRVFLSFLLLVAVAAAFFGLILG